MFSAVFALFAGKAYATFALLFGFTFYLQMNNARQRGADFGYRFLWRLVLLAGFATLNAAFFPAGDVLLLFAVVGIVLFLARNLSDRAVLAAAVLFLLQPAEWWHYAAWLADHGHSLPDLGVDAMYAEVAEVTKSGDFLSFIATNIGLGQKASLLWAVNAGRLSQTAGLFLLGFYVWSKADVCRHGDQPSTVDKAARRRRRGVRPTLFAARTGYGRRPYGAADRRHGI